MGSRFSFGFGEVLSLPSPMGLTTVLTMYRPLGHVGSAGDFAIRRLISELQLLYRVTRQRAEVFEFVYLLYEHFIHFSWIFNILLLTCGSSHHPGA